MVVSASPYEHMIGKPDVKYVANMHGNEAVGREMMLHLIHVCLQNQSFITIAFHFQPTGFNGLRVFFIALLQQ